VVESQAGERVLIDASPDLRTQLLQCGIDSVNAAIITHDHADHTHGLDDLRPMSYMTKTSLPVFGYENSVSGLTRKFPYIFDQDYFKEKPVLGGGIPKLHLVEVGQGPQSILSETFDFFSLPHGHTETMGIRHKSMAYIVDCQSIPEMTLRTLRDAQLELLIIDCLRHEAHQTHLHLDLTLEYINVLSPKLAVLIHMGHEFDYLELVEQIEKRGVKNTLPAVDGQSFLYS
jgi:phosphoribosyl 1,2-cyclic phosphate phosphodiesterase